MYTTLPETYRAFLSDGEQKAAFGPCTDDALKLILILRRLLQDTPGVDNVLYQRSRDGEYDSSDACMSETVAFAYRKDNGLKEMTRIITDAADTVLTSEESDQYSYGSIVSVNFDSVVGLHSYLTAWEGLKLLLRNVAATRWLRLDFPETGARIYTVRIEAGQQRGGRQDLARVHVGMSTRYHECFSIELL